MSILDSDKYTIPPVYASGALDKYHAIQKDMKAFYQDLSEAKVVIGTYIVYYEHASESLDFAIKQFNKAKDQLNSGDIEAEKKDEMVASLDECIAKCSEIQRVVSEKLESFNSVNTTLNDYIRRVISINETADNKITEYAIIYSPSVPLSY